MKSFSNYLDIQTRNNIFLNCWQQIEQQNCHFTCQDCDGPTKTDCLSCSEISQRIYILEHKACICPYDYLDDQINQNCLSFTDLSLQIKTITKENDCKFGYFEYDDQCYACPSIVSDRWTTCLECLQNVKGWKENLYCQTTAYLNPNGNTALMISEKIYYYFVSDSLEQQINIKINQDQITVQNVDSVFQDFYQLQQRFIQFCLYGGGEFYYEPDTTHICKTCTIAHCYVCSIDITEMKCITCLSTYQLIDGFCRVIKTYKTHTKERYQLREQKIWCTSPYYETSIKQCKLCLIKYCKQCFEYKKNDLTKCTLYAKFEIFEVDEYLGIGCALCEDDFIFDFQIGQCIYRQPSISNCLRSFVNLQNQETCTLQLTINELIYYFYFNLRNIFQEDLFNIKYFTYQKIITNTSNQPLSSSDFSVAPEISNCSKLIQNCLQCILTPQSLLKCIICKIGFSTSIIFGNCNPSNNVNATIVIEGDNLFADAWIQRVQSFIMKFLPNQYYYSRDYQQYLNREYQIECKEEYQVNEYYQCLKYCTSECKNCQVDKQSRYFYCAQCPLNYYYQHIRNQVNGQCIRCPELCEVCEERSEEEIYKLNPNFQLRDNNRMYSYKCKKPIQNQNVQIDPYFQIAKYCFTPSCYQELTSKYFPSQFQENTIDFSYYNQIGLQVLTVQNYVEDSFQYISYQTQLKSLIFSLQFIKLVLNVNSDLYRNGKFSGLDSIEINDLHIQILLANNYFIFENQKQKVNLFLNENVIEQSQVNNINSIFDSELFGDITLNNIKIISSNFNSSSLFNFNQNSQNCTINIKKMILQDCNFTNSQLFYFFNNKVQIFIEELVINQTQFFNSSFITFQNNVDGQSMLDVKGITIISSQFLKSYIFNCTNLQEITIKNFIFDNNSIILSTIISLDKNFTLLLTELNNNNFIESIFFAVLETETKKYAHFLVENYLVNQNVYKNSSLFYISKENALYKLRSDQLFSKYQITQVIINKYSVNNNQYQDITLFFIHCFQIEIDNVHIINSIKLRIFYFFEVTQIFASNIIYENLKINNKVASDLRCTDYQNYNNQLLLISECYNVNLKNIKAIKLFSIDQSLIELQPVSFQIDLSFIKKKFCQNNQFEIYINQFQTQIYRPKKCQLLPISLTRKNMLSRIEFINLEFIGNLLLHQYKANFLLLITIDSEQNTNIYIESIFFEKNCLHQSIDDLQESSTALIQITSSKGYIKINNLHCSYNALTNSSNSFIFLKSEIITLTNFTVSNHNILPLELWDLYYDLSLGNNQHEYDQEQINLIIQQTFKIKNKCGAGFISASSFTCYNCLFEDIIGLKSSVFEIKTQGEGNINLINLKVNSSEYDLSQVIDSSGCITIYSSESLLNLKIINAVFVNIFNRMATSILTIIPSYYKNQVTIQDVVITNCISLKNPIINLEFYTQNINSNKVIIRNASIHFQEGVWFKYFEKTGILSQNEISSITGSSNALIVLTNCNVALFKIFIQGFFVCPLIKLKNLSYLLISQLWAVQIQTFYGLNLLEFNLESPIKQTITINDLYFSRISIYQSINNPIYSKPKINYIIQGCVYIEKKQEATTYSFYQIIKLMQSPQKAGSIMQFLMNSKNTVMQVQNVILHEINCSYCSNGLIFFNVENYKTLLIKDFICYSNSINQFGCLNIAAANQINRSILIQNSNFFYNNGSSGVALYLSNIPIKIFQCKILNNFASNQGGGIYSEMNTQNFLIEKSIIINNLALEGGGIYTLKNGKINEENLIQTYFKFNKADLFSNNLVEFPSHLDLFINSQEMQSEEHIINNISIRILKLKPYKIIEQGVRKFSKYLMIPSQQVIKKYKTYIPQLQIVQNIFNDVQITLKNSKNELLSNSHQFSCSVSQATGHMNQVYLFNESKFISSLQIDQFTQFDLGSISFHYNPYQDESQNLQILVNCSSNSSQSNLLYLINARTYKCQLGEFNVDDGCQICESIFGFYSVTYDAIKCSIFDKTKFANITSHSIQLLEGFWRPNAYSDYTDYCSKNIKFCKGGWSVGDELCSLGHIGGLCEECDHYNKNGDGNFFKNQQDSQCFSCSTNNITPLIFSFIWAIISIVITLRSIETSNLLFSKLQFKLRYLKIFFKLEKDMEGILIKMLFIYLWIFSVIFTFNIKFSISFSFIDQTTNTSQFMASSLDCFLSEISQIELIYVKIIATILLILIQVTIILIGYQIYILASKGRFRTYIISNTFLYLYVSNFSGLIKQFCSIISSRKISNIEYIQGDLTLTFGSLNHIQWIEKFAIPGLALFGLCIPFALFLFMYMTKKKFNNIQFRRHICYLFDEYNEQSYFWEQIKFSKKIIIILVMTYYESNILLKASLLGLVLLQSKQFVSYLFLMQQKTVGSTLLFEYFVQQIQMTYQIQNIGYYYQPMLKVIQHHLLHQSLFTDHITYFMVKTNFEYFNNRKSLQKISLSSQGRQVQVQRSLKIFIRILRKRNPQFILNKKNTLRSLILFYSQERSF